MNWRPEQKEFNNLKQLDRIEYRQVKKEIEEETKTGFLESVILSILFMLGITIFGTLIVAINNSYLEEVTRLVSYCRVIFLYPVLILCLDIYSLTKRSKFMKELNSKYFSVSIKSKQRK